MSLIIYFSRQSTCFPEFFCLQFWKRLVGIFSALNPDEKMDKPRLWVKTVGQRCFLRQTVKLQLWLISSVGMGYIQDVFWNKLTLVNVSVSEWGLHRKTWHWQYANYIQYRGTYSVVLFSNPIPTKITSKCCL